LPGGRPHGGRPDGARGPGRAPGPRLRLLPGTPDTSMDGRTLVGAALSGSQGPAPVSARRAGSHPERHRCGPSPRLDRRDREHPRAAPDSRQQLSVLRPLTMTPTKDTTSAPGSVAPARRARYSRQGPGLVARFASAANVTEQHASQLIYGTNNLRDRVVKLIHCFHTAGREPELKRWLEPIEEAKAARVVPAFTPQLLLDAQAAEAKADAERLR